MSYQRPPSWMKTLHYIIFLYLASAPLTLYASFIESTIGTAVVNDATATFYNPAALTLLKNPQLIGLGSLAYFHSQFTGQVTQTNTGFTQSGNSDANTHYYLPSLYLGVPTTDKITLGIAIISNFFNRDVEENAILRYVQSSNRVQDIDFVPAIGIKLNEFFSIGGGITLTRANFILEPISGFPSLNIPDSQSHNDSSGTSWGDDLGILLTPNRMTLIGLNYRSAITYNLSGQSHFEGNPPITSTDYHFQFWTPARTVLSINQFVTPTLGFIGTIQRIQWDVFKTLRIYNIATQIGAQSLILPSATVNYYLHNTWVFTLGTHYRFSPQCIVRLAGTYSQSPATGNYQINAGDSIILGGSVGYNINKTITIDGSYAHAFIKNKTIFIATGNNIINGVNKAYRDAVSLKLTINL